MLINEFQFFFHDFGKEKSFPTSIVKLTKKKMSRDFNFCYINCTKTNKKNVDFCKKKFQFLKNNKWSWKRYRWINNCEKIKNNNSLNSATTTSSEKEILYL